MARLPARWELFEILGRVSREDAQGSMIDRHTKQPEKVRRLSMSPRPRPRLMGLGHVSPVTQLTYECLPKPSYFIFGQS